MSVNKDLHERFAEVFEKNLWQDEESVSGPGSRMDSPLVKFSIEALDHAIDVLGVRSIHDIPCGDFQWMEKFLSGHRSLDYVGFDIVDAIVRRNSETFRGFTFRQLDITTTVPPRADLIFSKEMLIHLTGPDILLALSNMKRSGSAYLLLSNNFGRPYTPLPNDGSASCRAVDLCAPPFGFPKPLWRNQFCGLWRMKDVPDFCNPTVLDRLFKRPARLDRPETLGFASGL